MGGGHVGREQQQLGYDSDTLYTCMELQRTKKTISVSHSNPVVYLTREVYNLSVDTDLNPNISNSGNSLRGR